MLSYFGGMALATLALTCGDLQNYYQQDQITEQKYSCSLSKEACKKLKLSRLKKTVAFFTGDDVTGKNLEDLENEYDPKFKSYLLGSTRLEGVDISLGDNPFVVYFWENTDTEAGVYSHDGSLSAGNDYCDAQLEPYLGDVRIAKVCEAVVPLVRSEAPQSKLTEKMCQEGISAYVEDHTDSTIYLYMSRNLADANGGYFTCNAEMDRKTDAVSNLGCNVIP